MHIFCIAFIADFCRTLDFYKHVQNNCNFNLKTYNRKSHAWNLQLVIIGKNKALPSFYWEKLIKV